MSRKKAKKKYEIEIQDLRLPFGNYVECDLCRKDWNWTKVLCIRSRTFVICPDCFKKFKKKVSEVV